jgi:hypothetical protein
MVASAKLVELASRASDFGVTLPTPPADISGVIERKRRVVGGMVDAHRTLFTTTPNMDFLLGRGVFDGERTTR